MKKVLLSSAAALLLLMQPTQAGEDPSAGDRLCLAEAMYYEARDQGWHGMLAVGAVIQNRVDDPRYPASICAVVRQGKYWNGNPVRNQCQFSYYCDGKPERPTEPDAWTTAQDIATLLTTTDVVITGLEDATNYHAVWVQPPWSTGLVKKATIGEHVFYARK